MADLPTPGQSESQLWNSLFCKKEFVAIDAFLDLISAREGLASLFHFW
jgi:hypothetical protein